MDRLFSQLTSHRISSQFLFIVILLLLIPVLVMLYDLYYASRTEEAMLQDYENKLQSTVDSVIIPKMKENLHRRLDGKGFKELGIDAKEKYLERAFNNNASMLVPSNPGVRFGMYIPDNKKVFIKGFLHQYRDLTPREQERREERVLSEAKSGLTAVAASGKPLSKLTRSLNDETYEYLSPLVYKGELVTVIWADTRLNPIIAQSRNFLSLIKYVALFGLCFGALGSLFIIRNLTFSVNTIKNGLYNMQKDIHTKIPTLNGEIGEIAGAINQMARSVEEKEKLEAELRRSERLASLGRLVAGVAHELRNPIGIVKTSTQLMEHELKDSVPEILEFSEVINEQVDRQNRVIKELLDFGRPSRPVVESISINALLEKVLIFTKAMLRQHNIELKLSIANQLPVVRVDGEQIKQVFVNLILNAVQAMPEGGTLTISTFVYDGYVCTCFADTGNGIPEGELQSIFDPFFTTKETGTGLGLSISHRIVTINKGTIDAESSENGTVFTVKFALPAETGGDF